MIILCTNIICNIMILYLYKKLNKKKYECIYNNKYVIL